MQTERTNTELKDVLRKIRNYEIKLRKALTGSVAGEIKSIVKGSGLEFDDIRPYQYGDDVRAIDWKVSAKGSGTYIKTFIEDKDQDLWVLFDLSASTLVNGGLKSNLIKELSSVLYLSALNQGTNVGLIGFTDEIELFSKPIKAKGKGISEITKVLKVRGNHKGTKLSKVLKKTASLIKKKSLVFVVSDFLDSDFEKELKYLSSKHEVSLFRVSSSVDRKTVPLGIVPTSNAEKKGLGLSIFSLFSGLNKTKDNTIKEDERFDELTSNMNLDSINVGIDGNYVNELITFFKTRLRRK